MYIEMYIWYVLFIYLCVCVCNLFVVSFGAQRKFTFRHKKDKNEKCDMNLSNGSIIVMTRGCQDVYKHGIPVEPNVMSGRISLTGYICDIFSSFSSVYIIHYILLLSSTTNLLK